MKNSYWKAAFTTLLVALAGQGLPIHRSDAQESRQFATRGVVEIGGSLSYIYNKAIRSGTSIGEMNMLSLAPYVGYFVTDNVQLGFNPFGIQHYWSSGTGNTLYTIFFVPAYNFTTGGNAYPFVEAQLGYTAQTNSGPYSYPTRDGFSWGLRGGVKISVGGGGLLNLGVQYQELAFNLPGDQSRSGSNSLMVSAGFTFWFQPSR